MAFLLSPKSGGGVTYALVSNTEVSINGDEPRKYTVSDPGTVAPGDVLTWSNADYNIYRYSPNTDFDASVKSSPASSPYTVEAVEGAAALMLHRSMG